MAKGGRRAHGPFSAGIVPLTVGDERRDNALWAAIRARVGKPITPDLRECLEAARRSYLFAIGLKKRTPLVSELAAYEKELRSALNRVIEITSDKTKEDLASIIAYQREDIQFMEDFASLRGKAVALRVALDRSGARIRTVQEVLGVDSDDKRPIEIVAFKAFLSKLEAEQKLLNDCGLRMSKADVSFVKLVSTLTGADEETCKSRIDEFCHPRERK